MHETHNSVSQQKVLTPQELTRIKFEKDQKRLMELQMIERKRIEAYMAARMQQNRPPGVRALFIFSDSFQGRLNQLTHQSNPFHRSILPVKRTNHGYKLVSERRQQQP